MRAREFIINVPITIKINGDSDPEISTDEHHEDDTKELGTNFAPPLQQKIELMKAAAGKSSKVIDQITADDDNEAY